MRTEHTSRTTRDRPITPGPVFEGRVSSVAATPAALDGVASVGISDLIGTGVVLVNGVSTSQFRFGDYSSVAIDPSNVNGSCAVTTQQYFVAGGSWTTRIARVGTC